MRSTPAKTLIDTRCGLRFAKSPRWVGRKLLFLDVHDRCIKSVGLEGEVRTVRSLPFLPGGFEVLGDDKFIVGDALRRKMYLLEATVKKQVADLGNAAGCFLCDSVIDSHGDMYVTDSGFDFLDPLVDPLPNGVVIHVRMDGRSSVVARDLLLPSGLIVTPDNKALVVAESLGHRLTVFDINDDGSLKNRRIWAQFQDDIKPDGICLDRENAIWVAGSGPIALHVREGGQVDHRITTKRRVFATTLGGPDLTHLFLFTSDSNDPVITRQVSSATIDIAEVDTPGSPCLIDTKSIQISTHAAHPA